MLSSFIPIFYVQLSPQRLTVRNARTGESISEIPEVAIARVPKTSIVGFGAEARLHTTMQSVEITNPFAHPRTLVSDFTVGEQLLKAFLRRMVGSSIFAVSPKVVLHPLGDPEGGFTQIEIRALHEMAMGAGASKVIIWQGRALSDQELLSGKFPSDGSILS
ncbi:MAG: rod shape-determining protein [Sideroxydans sp.]|nr:rod shape-determining protein [Sideroxydans sp.]